MTSIIAKEGYPIIAAAFGAAALLFISSLLASGYTANALRLLSLLVFVFCVFCLYFFRDPERVISRNELVLLAPADGTVIDIREVQEPLYLKGPARRVSIFMSVFNVHVNRAPVSGVIEFLKYNQGQFISAFKDKASDENESMFAGIRCSDRPDRIGVKFIAGLIARRIVFYRKLQDRVGQGERINMIRFGSRVDLFFPLTAQVNASLNQKVTAGVSVIATFPER